MVPQHLTVLKHVQHFDAAPSSSSLHHLSIRPSYNDRLKGEGLVLRKSVTTLLGLVGVTQTQTSSVY